MEQLLQAVNGTESAIRIAGTSAHFLDTTRQADKGEGRLRYLTLKLTDRDQATTATTHDAQHVHDVLLEEVDADTQGVGRFALRERKAAEQASSRLRCVVVESTARGHATTSNESSSPHPAAIRRPPLWGVCGAVGTPPERFSAASSATRAPAQSRPRGG
jgi:hypothetical protein